MKSKKNKIMFITSNMSGGGSEKMILNLCNNLDPLIYDITLVLMSAQGEYIDLLNNNIKIIDFKLKKKHGFVINTILGIYKLRKYIKQIRPNTIMSTITHINLFVSLFAWLKYQSARYIARESNILSLITKNDPFFLRKLYPFLYKKFDRIVCQSEDMYIDLVNNFKVNKENIVIINNFVDEDFINSKLSEEMLVNLPSNKINLLSVGRLEYQKGYDLLIKSFDKINNENLHLTILGQGNEEHSLLELVQDLGLNHKVTFLGFCSNPYKYMLKADLFISSSRFEGFPNVVIEALYCGLPVLANNYKGGINEILSQSFFGEIIDISNYGMFEKSIYENINKDRKLLKELTEKKYSKVNLLGKYINIF